MKIFGKSNLITCKMMLDHFTARRKYDTYDMIGVFYFRGPVLCSPKILTLLSYRRLAIRLSTTSKVKVT